MREEVTCSSGDARSVSAIAWRSERWVTVEKGMYWSEATVNHGHCRYSTRSKCSCMIKGHRTYRRRWRERRTHAIQSPSVFKLVFAPCRRNRWGFLFPIMLRQFLCDRLSRQECSIEIECDDCVPVRSHSESQGQPTIFLRSMSAIIS